MFRSLRHKILLIVITIMVISLLLNTALNYFISSRANSHSLNASLLSLAESHTSTIEEWVKSRIEQISALTPSIVNPQAVPILTQVAKSGNFLNVDIALPTGETISSDPSGIPDDYDPRSREWYLQAAKEKKTIITNPYQDVSSGQLTVTIASPLFNENELKGVVEGDISMGDIIENIRSIHPTDKSYGMLIDKEGTIIAHLRDDLTMIPLGNISNDLKLSELLSSAKPIEATISGSMTYVIARSVKHTPWYVVIAVDKAEAERGMTTLLKSSAVSLIILIIISIAIISYIMQQSISPLIKMRKSMDAFFASEKVDLTQRLPVKGRDEVAQIAMAFNSFTDKLVGVMTSISRNSEEIRTAAVDISESNNDLAIRTEESAASLQQTSASLEQISSTVAHSTSTARQANGAALAAANVANRGKESVHNVIEMMNEIELASSQIGSITNVINDIAFQTNILALNASVEAARAGEQGRGFAVVANEVRTLASRSADAAKDISNLIEKTVYSIESGVRQVDNTSSTMQEIVTSVSSVTAMISEISQAAEEQTKGIEEINKAVSQLDSMVQQNVSLVAESKVTSSELLKQANDMTDVISRYRIS